MGGVEEPTSARGRTESCCAMAFGELLNSRGTSSGLIGSCSDSTMITGCGGDASASGFTFRNRGSCTASFSLSRAVYRTWGGGEGDLGALVGLGVGEGGEVFGTRCVFELERVCECLLD